MPLFGIPEFDDFFCEVGRKGFLEYMLILASRKVFSLKSYLEWTWSVPSCQLSSKMS